MPAGPLQLQAGTSLARASPADTWGALAQWRYGLTPRLELRATAPRLLSIETAGGADGPGRALFLVASRPAGERTQLLGLVGLTRTLLDGDDVDAGQLGLLVARALGESVSGYVEPNAFPSLDHVPSSACAGAGVACLLSSNAQLDLSADFGLDDDAADVLAGLGCSIRW